jgi:hypothetical protein
MHDIVKDWRRWSRIERAAAVFIVSFLTVGVPTAIAINFHAMTTTRHSSEHTS